MKYYHITDHIAYSNKIGNKEQGRNRLLTVSLQWPLRSDMTSNLKSATSITLASICILDLLVALEAMATSEAVVASEVRYDLVFDISNISYPVI